MKPMLLAGGSQTRRPASTNASTPAPAIAPQRAKAPPREVTPLTVADARREWARAFDAYRAALDTGDLAAKADAVAWMREPASVLERARRRRVI